MHRSVAANRDPAEQQRVFDVFLPAVRTHATIRFRQPPRVDREEAVAETVAAAYLNFALAQRRGKSHVINPSMLATYAVRHVKDGRHVGGSRDGNRDVLNRRAQRLVLLEDRRTPVPDQVAFRIDRSTFLAQQTDRVRQMIGLLAAGHRRCDVADKFGVTRPAITQRMARVKREWEAQQADEEARALNVAVRNPARRAAGSRNHRPVPARTASAA